MRAYVAVTDNDWFKFLSSQPHLDEVNFWQPSGSSTFRALNPGELFLFKLHSPYDYIVGGGFFAASTNDWPINTVWEMFGIANGARNPLEMRARIEKYRHHKIEQYYDYKIGCILLEQPFFLERERWIPVPSNFSLNIVRGRTYDLSVEPGKSLWLNLLSSMPVTPIIREDKARYGEPVTIMPRLGQGSFRILVTDAYDRRCSITGERTLPALDAAHIKPFSESQTHEINNGILLRKDLHALFDLGYVTITPSYRFEVSRKIKEEFENGRDYYAMDGTVVRLPANLQNRPSREYLDWHNLNRFKG
jgi:putative restriction endonuclease